VLFSLLDAKYNYAVKSIPGEETGTSGNCYGSLTGYSPWNPSGAFASQANTIHKSLQKEMRLSSLNQ
jgi:hypothetical protein